MPRIADSSTTGVPAYLPDPEPEAGSTCGETKYEVKRGDTLSKIADRLRAEGFPGTRSEVVALLLKLNPEITNKDLIEVGQVLRVPLPEGDQPRTGASNTVAQQGKVPFARDPEPQPTHPAAGEPVSAGFLALTGTPAANKTPDGTPIYSQADPRWGKVSLGNDEQTISSKGCAMTSVAMVLSKLTGKPITPDVLDKHLDEHGGYAGNSIIWQRAADLAGPGITATNADWDVATIDKELAAGRGVVIGVHYHDDSPAGHTDHWMAITRKDPDEKNVYWASDPAGGRTFRMKRNDDGTLEMADKGRPYKTTGRLITFAPQEAV